MMPMLIENDEESRQLAEIWAIKTYQPKLNRRIDRLMPFIIRCDRISRNEGRRRVRHRPQAAADGLLPAQQPVVYTTYEMVGEQVTSTMLDSVLKIAGDRGYKDCVIAVTHGTHTVRPKRSLTERYMDSIVSVQFSNGRWAGKASLRNMSLAKSHCT
jgi:hypothetical protein